MRPLPLVVPETEAFWTGGRDGHLVVKRCPECGRLWHPSVTVCGACQARALEPAEVSGRATVVGCTVNLQQWLPDPAPPYVVAIVALDEDPRVRLTTNVIDVEPEAVTVGLRVEVRFEEQDDVWLPLFAPSGTDDPDVAAAAEPALPEVNVRPYVLWCQTPPSRSAFSNTTTSRYPARASIATAPTPANPPPTTAIDVMSVVN